MNTDFMIWDEVIRDNNFKNILSNDNNRIYDDSCKTIKQFAKKQNTIYDPLTNQILYGINSNMHAFGVSDGTCNQINPLIYTPNNICSAGTAGGNRCVKDAYGIENFDVSYIYNKCDACNVTQFVVAVILIIILIGAIHYKYNSDDLSIDYINGNHANMNVLSLHE